MALTIGIAGATALLMVATVLIKPYINIGKIKIGLYWVVCLLGAILMLATKRISFGKVIDGITANTSVNPLKILALFLSMTLLSIYLGDAGFFDFIADRIFLKSKGGQFKLFITLYLIVALLTVFTSNDVIILTFTPPICIFAKKAKISPLPFLFGEFIAANTWSMALIVGNPTNIYLAGSFGVTFSQYFLVMFLPAICGGLTSLLVLTLLFRKQLFSPLPTADECLHTVKKIEIKKVPMAVALSHLVVCIILLAISDFIGLEMWFICVCLALSLTAFDLIFDGVAYHTIKPVWHSIKKEPYELIPFVLSMFIIVLALKENGVTTALADLLITGKKTDAVTFGFISAGASNLLNNIPMSVLFEGIVNGQSLPALYGSVIGSNIGAFITPVGALAGIMWNKILGGYKIKLSFFKFMLYGTAVAIPTLLTSTLSLLLLL